jgi:hypothetical protein
MFSTLFPIYRFVCSFLARSHDKTEYLEVPYKYIGPMGLEIEGPRSFEGRGAAPLRPSFDPFGAIFCKYIAKNALNISKHIAIL